MVDFQSADLGSIPSQCIFSHYNYLSIENNLNIIFYYIKMSKTKLQKNDWILKDICRRKIWRWRYLAKIDNYYCRATIGLDLPFPVMDICEDLGDDYDFNYYIDFTGKNRVTMLFFTGDSTYFTGIWIGDDDK